MMTGEWGGRLAVSLLKVSSIALGVPRCTSPARRDRKVSELGDDFGPLGHCSAVLRLFKERFRFNFTATLRIHPGVVMLLALLVVVFRR